MPAKQVGLPGPFHLAQGNRAGQTAEFGKFRRLVEDQEEVRLLRRDRQGELLILHDGCISREAARRLEDGWN